MIWLRAALGSLMLGGFLGFGYVAMTAVLHPDRMPEPVVHFLSLRLDTFGAICFATSFVTQIALGLSRISRTREVESE
jgi:hypothetical protein